MKIQAFHIPISKAGIHDIIFPQTYFVIISCLLKIALLLADYDVFHVVFQPAD